MITYLPYYHLDAAFDNGLRKDYGNSEIRYDHFYYKEKKLSFTKTEEVYKRFLQAAKKGKTLTFHWRGGYLTREVLEELLDLMQQAGAVKNKTAVVGLNWAQAVLRLHYVESAEAGDENAEAANGAIGKGTHKAKIDVTMEDANEGEQIETD